MQISRKIYVDILNLLKGLKKEDDIVALADKICSLIEGEVPNNIMPLPSTQVIEKPLPKNGMGQYDKNGNFTPVGRKVTSGVPM